MMTDLHVHDLIDRAFADELPGAEQKRLHAHLSSCEPCRARYNRVASLDRYLNGGALDQPSPMELDRIAGVIFEKEEPSLFARIRALLAAPQGMALAAAALALVIGALIFVPKMPSDELRARGSLNETRPASVRAFCVHEGEIAELPACSLSSELKLALGNKGGYRYAFVVGLQSDGSPRWYAPRPPATESVSAPAAGEGEVPFGSAVRLEINHEKGALRVFALLSDQPIAMKDVEAAIASASRAAKSPAAIETLPLSRKDVAQRSVLLEVLAP